MNHPISDLHIHCGFKGYASDGHPSAEDLTIWDFYPPQEASLKKLNPILKGAIKETAKSSQANLDACVASNLCAPFIAIYPVERQMFALEPQRPFRNILNLLLKGKQPAYLGSAVAGYPLERVEAILNRAKNSSNIGINYYHEFRKERAYLLRQQETRSKQFPDFRFQVVSDYDQFRESVAAGKTITGLFTVEGAHSFGHYFFNSTFKKEYPELDIHEREVLEQSMITNITEVKTENDGQFAPFFVTFCHHFNNLLAGHARSMSDKSKGFLGINVPGMRHVFNQETGLNGGFTDLGLQVLELLLDRKSGRRILIDTKHMSIATRKEFYRIIRQKREEENDHIPIIHSHGAVSGWMQLSIAEEMEENAALDKGHFFSRWRINLTDEDIRQTFDSDGLIGIVLHEGRTPGEGFKSEAKKLKKKIDKAVTGSKKQIQLQQQLKDMYLKLIWSNIFHIVKVVWEHRTKNGWKMISLGSDYDGLVDPMDAFPEVTTFSDLRSDLIEYLESGKEIYFSQNGTAQPIATEEVRRLQFGQSAEAILDDILFGNTDRFLSKYFTEAYLGQQPSKIDVVVPQPA